MEKKLKELIDEFLKIDFQDEYGLGSGDGSGYGSEYGDGHGYGDGSGSGEGSGFGFGEGHGYGYGSGDGSGYGSGYGKGSSSGAGFIEGYGHGYGYDYVDVYEDVYGTISIYNNYKVYMIDDIPTIITYLSHGIAKGFIVNDVLTLEATFVVKGSNKFAHGKTIKEAMQNLQEKIYSELDISEKIEAFKQTFKKDEKYLGHEYFKWHHILTGSCLQGRNSFVQNNGIDLDKYYSVKEFLDIVKNQYGWNYIKDLCYQYKE